MSTPEGVIPYIDVHDGPKRILTVSISGPDSVFAGPVKTMMMPSLSIDGRTFVVYWGSVGVEVPADRAVHVSVALQDGMRGASMLLPPGPGPLVLDYHVPQTGAVSFAVRPPPA